MTEPVNIKLDEFVIEVEGVKISIAYLKELMYPTGDCLLNIKRVGDVLEFRRFDNAESAAKFFENRERV